jgi:hypothetical protein
MAAFDNPLETWNARFAGEEFLFGEEPNVFLRNQAHWLRMATQYSALRMEQVATAFGLPRKGTQSRLSISLRMLWPRPGAQLSAWP